MIGSSARAEFWKEGNMSVKAERLETEVLAGLRSYSEGKRDDSITGWGNSLRETFGEHIDLSDIVATFIRLRNRGLIRLLKCVPEHTAWYVYAPDERVDEKWFFYHATFVVEITNEGRGWWDIPRRPIGFQQSV
jgi:hypothetical protein